MRIGYMLEERNDLNAAAITRRGIELSERDDAGSDAAALTATWPGPRDRSMRTCCRIHRHGGGQAVSSRPSHWAISQFLATEAGWLTGVSRNTSNSCRYPWP
jgi:hypothetical protein